MNSTIVNNNIEDTFPVSDQQQRMIKFIGGRTDSYYSMIESFILNGPLDIQALKTALIRVLDRHDVLRAIYPEEHQVYKLVGSGLDIIDIIWNEEKDKVFPSCEDALATGIEALTLPMKLDVEPPLRTWLTRVGNNSTVLIVCGHHLVFDAWTFMLFYEDLEKEYKAAQSVNIPRKRPRQYAEVQPPADPSAIRGWSKLFGHKYCAIRSMSSSVLSIKGPGVIHQRSWVNLNTGVIAAAKHFSVTPFVIASVAMLQSLSEVLGDKQVIFGSAYAGRSTAATAETIGYYSTTLFIGEDLSAYGKLEELVNAVSAGMKSWHNKSRIQWENLLEFYQAEDLYPVKFAFQPRQLAERKVLLPGIETIKTITEKSNLSARRPVDLIVVYDDDSISAKMISRADVLEEGKSLHLLECFGKFLSIFANRFGKNDRGS